MLRKCFDFNGDYSFLFFTLKFINEFLFLIQQVERRNGWINVGDLQGAVHFKIVKYERIKFLVIALKDSIEIYAWAPKPYHKFMAFKVSNLLISGFTVLMIILFFFRILVNLNIVLC